MAEKWSVPLGSNLCALLSRPIPPCIPHGLQEDGDMGGGDGAELQFLLKHWKLHFTAERAGIPTLHRTPGARRGDKI